MKTSKRDFLKLCAAGAAATAIGAPAVLRAQTHSLKLGMGTWVGYRITKAYYQRAADKQQALREILGLSDPKAFLSKSGWQPAL